MYCIPVYQIFLSFFRCSPEPSSPGSTGIRTLNYLRCYTDWVSLYQPGSERNYRRSGSPNQTTAAPVHNSKETEDLNSTECHLPASLQRKDKKIQLTRHWNKTVGCVHGNMECLLQTVTIWIDTTDSGMRWWTCDPWTSRAAKDGLRDEKYFSLLQTSSCLIFAVISPIRHWI